MTTARASGIHPDRPAVIGIGNEHRGDDVAGLLAVRALRARLDDLPGLDLLEHRGDGISLLDVWDGRPWVVLIDAVRTTGPPGEVLRLDASDRALEVGPGGPSSHAFGPAGAIEMARTLGRLPRRVEVIGIVGARFSMGAEPLAPVCTAAETVAETLAERLRSTTALARKPPR